MSQQPRPQIVQSIAYVGKDGSIGAVLSPENTAKACTQPSFPGAKVLCTFPSGTGNKAKTEVECSTMPLGDGGISALCEFAPHPRCGPPDRRTGFSRCAFGVRDDQPQP